MTLRVQRAACRTQAAHCTAHEVFRALMSKRRPTPPRAQAARRVPREVRRAFTCKAMDCKAVHAIRLQPHCNRASYPKRNLSSAEKGVGFCQRPKCRPDCRAEDARFPTWNVALSPDACPKASLNYQKETSTMAANMPITYANHRESRVCRSAGGSGRQSRQPPQA